MTDPVSTSAASWPLRLFAVAVMVLVIAVRVSLIVDGKVAADSEECVIGMMALSGHGGEAGAGLEARLLAPILAMSDNPTRAVKFLALAIWIALAAATFLAGRAMFGPRASWVVLPLMAASPTGALWSMKLRGGQLSSLVLLMAAAAALFQLLDREATGDKKDLARAGAVGGLAVLAAWVKLETAPAAAVLLLIALSGFGWRRQGKRVAATLAAAGFAVALALWLSRGSGPGWRPAMEPVLAGGWSWLRLPSAALAFFTPHLDTNLLDQPVQDLLPLLLRGTVALVWLVMFTAALLDAAAGLAGPRTSRDYSARLFLVAATAVTVGAVVVMVFSRLTPRYFLALYPVGALLSARALVNWSEDRPAIGRVMLAVLVTSGVAVGLTFFGETRLYNPRNSAGLELSSARATVAALRERRVSHVFSADPEFEWGLMFESNGEIVARSWDPADRWPPYVAEVNRAAINGEPVAVVVPNPDLPERRDLLDNLLDDPHTATVWPTPDVAVVFGVPADYVFLYFPMNVPP